MKRFITFLTYLSAINGLLLFIRPGDRALNTLIWFPKMIGAALTPVLGVAGLLGALLGLVKGERSLALAGLLGAGLSAISLRNLGQLPNCLIDLSRIIKSTFIVIWLSVRNQRAVNHSSPTCGSLRKAASAAVSASYIRMAAAGAWEIKTCSPGTSFKD